METLTLGQEIKTVSIKSGEPQIVRTIVALLDNEIICMGIDRRFDLQTGWSLTSPYQYYIEEICDPRTWDARREELVRQGLMHPATAPTNGENYGFDIRDLRAMSNIRKFCMEHQRGLSVDISADGSYVITNAYPSRFVDGWGYDSPMITARAHSQLHAAWEGFLLKLEKEGGL